MVRLAMQPTVEKLLGLSLLAQWLRNLLSIVARMQNLS
jgi:hypothetical protein